MEFRYRLQILLDQKTREKDAAQQALAAVQRALQLEQEELGACRREQDQRAIRLGRARAEVISSAAGGSKGEWIRLKRDHVWRLIEEYSDALDETRAQELKVSEAEEAVAAARLAMVARSRDVEVLEKHRARLERRFKNEADRKESLAQEEMANVMFLQGRNAT
jgi:flagellar biosynthesis chaperone FliJ